MTCDFPHPSGGACCMPKGHDGRHRLDQAVHRCHAIGCLIPVKPEMLMCIKHWRMVPKSIQRRVWTTYRDGQCDDKCPSEAWHSAADAAISFVAKLEAAR